ncbi:recombinase family protein [Paraburkholderia sacchari]|uniref:Recombinase family protein n=2 Tax=Paraburkholderia sacchari TaxID=159450 RepID=A0A8T6ZL40_9BURK|nr:recombinase family protein [Paraburkholderia sacchari]NLP65378.1 recombinase family protein [Paraburkholderia sacchari]
MRVAIYARFSTDKQKETSVTDQVKVCAKCAHTFDDCEIVAQHSDEGVSGSTRVESRAGGKKLMADAMAGHFEVLVVEALDRLSRDQVEQETILRRLEFRGIRIIGVADGYDSTSSSRKVQRAVRGLVNELYIDDLRCKTLRGQTGQVERGFVAGGKSYGYDIVKTDHGSDYRVNEEQAKWVRFIFEKFAAGWSTFQLCDYLNANGVPSPCNSTWMRSALYGSPRKGSGILNNSAYIGVYIWNRSQWIKDPDTGARVRQDRPESEWTTEHRDHYRIVTDEVWQAVRARMGTDRLNAGTSGAGRPPRTLFGGLLRCPSCGGAMVAVSARAYGCVTRKERGSAACPGVHLRREQTDERLLGVLRDELGADVSQADIEAAVRRYFAGEYAGAQESAKQIKEKIGELTDEIANLTAALAKIGVSDALLEALSKKEREREALKRTLAHTQVNADQFTDIARRVRERTNELREALSGDATAEARQIIAKLMGPIGIELRDGAYFAAFDDVSERMLLSATGEMSPIVVAGVGFEPTTFGL